MIFRSEWTKLRYTLNLVRCFLLHLTKFQNFFSGFKSQLSNSYDNWYVQKYLKGIFHKGMLLIWKEYFTHAILSFSSRRCAIIARLNVIYTKFRRAIMVQLNKLWCVWACARAIACHSRPGLSMFNEATIREMLLLSSGLSISRNLVSLIILVHGIINLLH